MKTIFRNFISVLRRFKVAVILNLLGLSIAYAAFIMIMMQVKYDNNFDSSQSNADRIYRLDMVYPNYSRATVSQPFANDFIASSPHIKAGMTLAITEDTRFFYVEHNGQKIGQKITRRGVSPELFQVFDVDIIQGSENPFKTNNSVIIPESMAQRLFGKESAIGRQIRSDNSMEDPLTIEAVYKDFPRNSSLKNIMYWNLSPNNNWNQISYNFFLRLNDADNKEDVIHNFKRNFDVKQHFGCDWGSSTLDIRLTSLPDLHFLEDVKFDFLPKASHTVIFLLMTIAFIIIAIAAINFTNFSTALTPMRIKNISTQKVLGSSNFILKFGMICEALCVSVGAYLMALGLLSIIARTSIASLIDASMAFSQNGILLIEVAGLSLLVGLLAGIYPANYATSFPPALVLKGNYGQTPKGRKLRNCLVGLQFVVSFTLLISAIFMYLQNNYMQNTSPGYERDELIIVNMNSQLNRTKEAYSNLLKSFPAIEDVAYAGNLLGSQDNYSEWGRWYKNQNISFQCIDVSANFLKVTGIEVESGRDFFEEDQKKESGTYIFNNMAKKQYELELNESIGGGEIIGFIPDIKFASYRRDISPMAFHIRYKYWDGKEVPLFYSYSYIKVKAGSNLHTTMDHVLTTLAKIDPDYPFEVRFYDEVLQATYENEEKISSQISLFSLIAIFISIVGVFGLVVFESEYRRKEVGIRKIMGSTTRQILLMFTRLYMIILGICFLLAIPIAWYGIKTWLENFVFHIPIYFWVFLLAFVTIATLTCLTVVLYNWRLANENPVNNVKAE